MACGFTREHYGELLDAIARKYQFGVFYGEPKPGFVYLRHDVDLSLRLAVEMATLEFEHEPRVQATYFVMTAGVFYNAQSPDSRHQLATLRALGHRVGLHAVYPDGVAWDHCFDGVMSWHTPEPSYMRLPVDGVVNVMADPWFAPWTYRSDSNASWRHGCPCKQLRRGAFEWLQLLVHPEPWLLEGETLKEKIEAFLDDERRLRYGQLAEYKVVF